MAIITRFGGSGGGTPVVDPYPHVWECTVVQSGTTGVVSGVVTLEAYDILHYTMPLGFSTYDLMIGGVTYHTSFRNEGEMYTQWTGSEFVVVSANAACALSHVWTSPTYTITGTVLEITAGVDDLHTNDVIVLTLASGESASNIEYNSQVYTIDLAISEGTNYVQFNGTSFDNALFNFKGDATASDVASGKTFYSSDGTLRTGSAVMSGVPKYTKMLQKSVYLSAASMTGQTLTFEGYDLNKCVFTFQSAKQSGVYYASELEAFSAVQSGDDVVITFNLYNNYTGGALYMYITCYELDCTRVYTTFTHAPTVNQVECGSSYGTEYKLNGHLKIKPSSTLETRMSLMHSGVNSVFNKLDTYNPSNPYLDLLQFRVIL